MCLVAPFNGWMTYLGFVVFKWHRRITQSQTTTCTNNMTLIRWRQRTHHLQRTIGRISHMVGATTAARACRLSVHAVKHWLRKYRRPHLYAGTVACVHVYVCGRMCVCSSCACVCMCMCPCACACVYMHMCICHVCVCDAYFFHAHV